MTLMLIIADDLTGAADSGVACAGHGLHTMVVLGDADGEISAEALSIDGDTRRLPPDIAASETARLLKRYLRRADTLVYKKIDSTLRGNVGEELAAILAARRASAGVDERIVVVLAPAFPAADRTTLDGRQLVIGRPLEESGLFQNDCVPARSDIAAILRAAHLRPEVVALDLIRDDGAALGNAMQAKAQHADVLVCDAETDDDLRRIAEASMVLGRKTVWAGSAGLAWHMPGAAGLSRAPATRPGRPMAVGPALFVVGTGSAIAREQVEVLASRSETIAVKIPSTVLMTEEQSPQRRDYRLELERALDVGSDVAVLPDPAAHVGSSTSPLLTAALAEIVRPFADKAGALVVTGGETARAVFESWGISRLQLLGEVEAGLPFSVTSGWSRELPVLTKAGGFGGPESLFRCLEFLHSLNRGEAAEPSPSEGPQCKGLK